jgi:hypothetical protein
MQKKLVLGALLGGAVLFIWGGVSHMALGWYDQHLRSFTDQQAVEQAVVSTVSGSGLYLLPNLTPAEQSLIGDERAAARQDLQERLYRGPMMFAVVRIGPGTAFPVRLTMQFFLFALAALVATWLLMQARLQSYSARAVFVATMALPIIFSSKLPQWNWWDYPAGFILVESADILIGWALLGAVLGRIAKPEAAG